MRQTGPGKSFILRDRVEGPQWVLFGFATRALHESNQTMTAQECTWAGPEQSLKRSKQQCEGKQPHGSEENEK